uniref:C-type lectin domain-containing protein n=1 Tax=Amphiprion ocellaris TaxID=80972 RepID=A0AAQ6AQZ9_AMPOC
MERIIVLLFFCIAVEGDIGKHIYISKSLNWNDAQAYCRRYHTDLSFFNRQSDIDRLRKDVGRNISRGWIGLHRDPDDTAWVWSGGGHITYQNWAAGQPNNHKGKQKNVVIKPDGTWNDLNGKTEIKNITERVWIGLRFLGDHWMWVNGDPLEYEAWSQEGGQDHQCPIRKRCGALTNERLWENRDCQEKLYFICV